MSPDKPIEIPGSPPQPDEIPDSPSKPSFIGLEES